MGKRCRFVQPESVRLPLSDGEWVEVKKQLSVGEERKAFQAIVGEVKDGWRRPNVEMIGVAEMAAYLVDWSFRDAQDKPVPVSVDAITQLDTETFTEIERALQLHDEAMRAEREARKNAQSTSIASGATL